MTTITENQWVKHHRFQRFPFDRPEAGNEEFARPDFLASCFVKPRSFERILGWADTPVTSLLFAARGSGKTACRVMVDYYCRSGLVPVGESPDREAYVLSVPHIFLDRIPAIARLNTLPGDTPLIRVEHHVWEILNRAVVAFVDLVASATTLRKNVSDLSVVGKRDLGWLISAYSTYLSSYQVTLLNDLGIGGESSIGFTPAQKETPPSVSWDPALSQASGNASPLDHLTQWAALLHDIGIEANYILVDGVDEFATSAGSPAEAFQVIRPLLTTLRLMDGTSHTAFKFFLPDTINSFVQQDLAIRQDRGFLLETIQWQEEDLIDILRQRLAVLRVDKDVARVIPGFDDLCVPELRGQIETKLAKEARGNPRHLLILCGLMARAHFDHSIKGQDDPYQLNREDWEMALQRYGRRKVQWQQTPASIRIQQLIDLGEQETLEFKSSLRWDFHRNAVSKKELPHTIAKSIAAMLNSRGGTLLIGVADDGQITGISKDVQTLRKKDMDGFQLALQDTIAGYVGDEVNRYLHIQFVDIAYEQICIVEIAPSESPVFVKNNTVNEFWIRAGNSTRQLDAKAVLDYIPTHWSNLSK